VTKRNKKNTPPFTSSQNITVGDISGGTGIAIGPGAQATVTKNTGDDPITIAFKAIEQANDAMPDGPHKDAANATIKNLESEARKGDKADETKVNKWINFLAEIAPDVWEVAIDTLSNPIKGIGTAFIKVAGKAKQAKEAVHET